MTNSADPDQSASEEADWSGSALFAKEDVSGSSRTRVNKQIITKLTHKATMKCSVTKHSMYGQVKHWKTSPWTNSNILYNSTELNFVHRSNSKTPQGYNALESTMESCRMLQFSTNTYKQMLTGMTLESNEHTQHRKQLSAKFSRPDLLV